MATKTKRKPKRKIEKEPKNSWILLDDGQIIALEKGFKFSDLEKNTAWLLRGNYATLESLQEIMAEDLNGGIVVIETKVKGIDWVYSEKIDGRGEVAITPLSVSEAEIYSWMVFANNAQSLKLEEYFKGLGYEIQSLDGITTENEFLDFSPKMVAPGIKDNVMLFNKKPRRVLRVRNKSTPIMAIFPEHAEYCIEQKLKIENLVWPLDDKQAKYINKKLMEA